MVESVGDSVQHLIREFYRPFAGVPELVRGFGEAAVAVTESRLARIVLRNPEGADLHLSVGEEVSFRSPLRRSRFPIRYQAVDLGFLEVFSFARKRGSDEQACSWIAKALAYHLKRQEVSGLARRRFGREIALVGTSESLARIDRFVERVSQATLPALISGNHGSEVERIALALHLAGPWRDEAFVQVSCAVFDRATLEEQLLGLLREAHKGTLLLSSLEELDLGSQKLLGHLLEIGLDAWAATRGCPFTIRLLATTHRNLEEMVRKGDFCPALLERLDFLRLEVEPLRNRREDIRPLLEYYLRCHASGETPRISAEALEACVEYDWPGDLSELSRVAARLVVMTEDGIVLPEHILRYAPQILDARSFSARNPLVSTTPDFIAMLSPSLRFHLEACHPSLRKAVDFISKNFHRKLSLGEVAASVHVSSSHLAHLFQQNLGTSFVPFLTALRVKRAQGLLSEHPWEPIARIASAVGFSDLRSFERTFKQSFGCTPRAFRKARRARRDHSQAAKPMKGAVMDLKTMELLADLSPEDLEPRLELQLFIDPMTSLAAANQNQNNGNQQQQQQKVL